MRPPFRHWNIWTLEFDSNFEFRHSGFSAILANAPVSATVSLMRIIAGKHRGRHLLAPETDKTRPITDRAKQSVFDILSPMIEGAAVYDCFAGTGSMGLECLSRGAKQVTFFEMERSALGLLKQNVAALNVQEQSRIVAGDLFAWFDNERRVGEEIDLVFLDPPYRLLREKPRELQRLAVILASGHWPRGEVLCFGMRWRTNSS
jgi:16S rRNA (guanine(966)-N(2))-methyltransferase RsmD